VLCKEPSLRAPCRLRGSDKDFAHAVSSHGVDETLVERLFEENRNFFALPEEEKRRMLVDKNSRRVFFYFMLTFHC
jgi:isopenicillin N synthase-like dioxygenase